MMVDFTGEKWNFHAILFSFYYLAEQFLMQLETIKLVYCFRVNGIWKWDIILMELFQLYYTLFIQGSSCVWVNVCSLTFIIVWEDSSSQKFSICRKMEISLSKNFFFEKHHWMFDEEKLWLNWQSSVMIANTAKIPPCFLVVAVLLPIPSILHLRSFLIESL